MPKIQLEAEITHTYNAVEAKEVIRRSMDDYRIKFEDLDTLLTDVEVYCFIRHS